MKCNAEFGDKVNVKTTTEGFDGIYLPSPENGTFLLKLKSGYNIGFNNRDVMSVDLIKKKEKNEELFEIVKDGAKSTIGLVILGGTISAKSNPGRGGVDWVDTPEELFKIYPELFNLVNVEIVVPFMKGSENMDYKDWQKVSKVVAKLLNKKNISGVIVTQGTDTLHYTSSALSFFLRDLNKPVAVTYSQRSIDRASSDAALNLECSIKVATSDMAEVVVVGHETTEDSYCIAIPGTKVRKLHTSKRDAFKAINTEPYLRINKKEMKKISDYNIRNDKKVICDSVFSEKVGVIKFYPGQNPDIIDYYIENGYKGIIIEMTGLGHIATSGARLSFNKRIKKAQENGIIIFGVAQTIYGRLNPLVYVTGRELEKLGIIYLDDMLSETAYVKLSWVLGHPEWAKDKKIIKEKMLTNFSHELNDRIIK